MYIFVRFVKNFFPYYCTMQVIIYVYIQQRLTEKILYRKLVFLLYTQTACDVSKLLHYNCGRNVLLNNLRHCIYILFIEVLSDQKNILHVSFIIKFKHNGQVGLILCAILEHFIHQQLILILSKISFPLKRNWLFIRVV